MNVQLAQIKMTFKTAGGDKMNAAFITMMKEMHFMAILSILSPLYSNSAHSDTWEIPSWLAPFRSSFW